jgi:CubicO group peptidase (beta-lactamase class C family)
MARADKVDDLVRAEMAKTRAPGVAVAVVKAGTPAIIRTYGYGDAELKAPVTPDTLFEIGSITKQFTAACVLMLAEAGKLNVDDKAFGYLPDLPEPWRGVTIRQLLTHTSGIPNYTAQEAFSWSEDYDANGILKLVSDKPLNFPSGDRFEYSNTNYYLLGLLVTRVSSESLDEFMRKRIFAPLGMTHTRFADAKEVIPHRAHGYSLEASGLVNAPTLRKGAAGGAGGILSTVGDMAKWDAALYSNTLLKVDSRKEMWTPARLNGGGSSPYGFGWAIAQPGAHGLVDHSGGTAGFNSLIARYRDAKLTVIVLANVTGGAEPIARKLATIYLPDLAPKPLKPGVDAEPKVTERIKTVALSLLSDSPDMSPFTEQMKAALTPQMLSQVRGGMNALGPMKGFAFLDKQTLPEGTRYRYVATFGTTPLVVTAVIDMQDKISGLLVSPQ